MLRTLKVCFLICMLFLLSSCEKKVEATKIEESKEISILVENNEDMEYVENIIGRFEKINKNIKVNLFDAKNENGTKSLIGQNILPDIIFYNPNTFDYKSLIDNNKIKDISQKNFFKDINNFKDDRYNKYLVPVSADGFGLIVNKDLVFSENLTVSQNINWKELDEICKNLKNKKIYPFGFYMIPKEKFADISLSILSSINENQYNDFREKNKTESNLKNIGILMQYIGYAYKNSDFENSYDYEQVLNEFASERFAMMFGTNEDILNLLYINPKFNMELISLPYLGSEKKGAVITVNRALSVTADNEENIKFLEYFTGTEAMNYFINSKGYFSMVNTVNSNLPELQYFNLLINNAGYIENFSNNLSKEFKMELFEIIEKYLTGDDVKAIIQKTLEKYFVVQ